MLPLLYKPPLPLPLEGPMSKIMSGIPTKAGIVGKNGIEPVACDKTGLALAIEKVDV